MALCPLRRAAHASFVPRSKFCLHTRYTGPRSRPGTSRFSTQATSSSQQLHRPRSWQPSIRQQSQRRHYSCTLRPHSSRISSSVVILNRPPPNRTLAPIQTRRPFSTSKPSRRQIKIYPPPPSARKACKEPINYLTKLQLATLDPDSARTNLFNIANPECANVGDILLVRTRDGDPFAGVCLSIRKRGVDSAILLRNQLTRVGVEMWFKIYSPNVEGIEVVQRRPKRARRARLYYMRQPRHDMGSVDGVVSQYLRQRAMLRSGEKGGKRHGGGKGKKKA